MILPEEQADVWLRPSSQADELTELLVPIASENMQAFPVHRSVGNVRNDTPLCIRRIETKTQRELF